jgi:hypothetical protein
MRSGYQQGEFFEGCRVAGTVMVSMAYVLTRLRGGIWAVDGGTRNAANPFRYRDATGSRIHFRSKPSRQ